MNNVLASRLGGKYILTVGNPSSATSKKGKSKVRTLTIFVAALFFSTCVMVIAVVGATLWTRKKHGYKKVPQMVDDRLEMKLAKKVKKKVEQKINKPKKVTMPPVPKKNKRPAPATPENQYENLPSQRPLPPTPNVESVEHANEQTTESSRKPSMPPRAKPVDRSQSESSSGGVNEAYGHLPSSVNDPQPSSGNVPSQDDPEDHYDHPPPPLPVKERKRSSRPISSRTKPDKSVSSRQKPDKPARPSTDPVSPRTKTDDSARQPRQGPRKERPERKERSTRKEGSPPSSVDQQNDPERKVRSSGKEQTATSRPPKPKQPSSQRATRPTAENDPSGKSDVQSTSTEQKGTSRSQRPKQPSSQREPSSQRTRDGETRRKTREAKSTSAPKRPSGNTERTARSDETKQRPSRSPRPSGTRPRTKSPGKQRED